MILRVWAGSHTLARSRCGLHRRVCAYSPVGRVSSALRGFAQFSYGEEEDDAPESVRPQRDGTRGSSSWRERRAARRESGEEEEEEAEAGEEDADDYRSLQREDEDEGEYSDRPRRRTRGKRGYYRPAQPKARRDLPEGDPTAPSAYPDISRPPSKHFPPGTRWDPLNVSYPVSYEDETADDPDPEMITSWPLPPLPPSSFLYPGPSHPYLCHRVGSFLDCFKHLVLTQLILAKQQAVGSGISYVEAGGGNGAVAFDISRSINRGWGVDTVYEWGRWWAQLQRRLHQTVPHAFVPLMHTVRLINGRPEPSISGGGSAGISRLERGFRLYPGNAAIIRNLMRPHDRAVFFEGDSSIRQQLSSYFSQPADDPSVPPLNDVTAWSSHLKTRPSDHIAAPILCGQGNRVLLHPHHPFNVSDSFSPLVSHGKVLTSDAIVHIDLTLERWENFRHKEQVLAGGLLHSLFRQFGNATFITSFPLYGTELPLELVRAHVSGGHRDVMMLTHIVQELRDAELHTQAPESGLLPQDEAWGVGCVIVKPPSGFDGVSEWMQEDVDDINAHIPYSAAAKVDIERVLADEEETGLGLQRQPWECDAISEQVMQYTFYEPLPPFAWLTFRPDFDNIDWEQQLLYQHAAVKRQVPNGERQWKTALKVWKLRDKGRDSTAQRSRRRPLYYNAAKLVADTFAPAETPSATPDRKEKRMAAERREQEEMRRRATERKEEVQRVTDGALSEELRQTVEAVHANEGLLLKAWKQQVQQSRQSDDSSGGAIPAAGQDGTSGSRAHAAGGGAA